MSLSAPSVVRPAPGVEASQFGADFVLLDGSGKVLRGLNATASRVWALLDGVRSAEQIASVLAGEFQVTEAQALADTLSFLQALLDKGLVARV